MSNIHTYDTKMSQKCHGALHVLVAISSLMLASLSLCPGAQSVTLACDASSDPNVLGYMLRYGTTSGSPNQDPISR
jgi:hypothetical protein